MHDTATNGAELYPALYISIIANVVCIFIALWLATNGGNKRDQSEAVVISDSDEEQGCAQPQPKKKERKGTNVSSTVIPTLADLEHKLDRDALYDIRRPESAFYGLCVDNHDAVIEGKCPPHAVCMACGKLFAHKGRESIRKDLLWVRLGCCIIILCILCIQKILFDENNIYILSRYNFCVDLNQSR